EVERAELGHAGEQPREGRLRDGRAHRCACLVFGSSLLGVPERRAHSEPSGPAGSQINRNSVNAAVPPAATPRARGEMSRLAPMRTITAASTTRTQIVLSSCNQPLLTSLPVPKPCSRATGHAP